MTDWNLGQRGDITKIALAREIGLDGIQVSLQFPTDGNDADAAGCQDPGGLPARGARERHPDLLARHRFSGQIADAAAHEPGRRHPARRSRGSRAQPRHEQHPASDPGRQPHRHDESVAGEYLRRHDEGSGALRGEARCGRRYRGLDLGRGQHPAARCHRIGLRGRLLRRAQHRRAGGDEGHLCGAEDARQTHQPDSREECQHAAVRRGRQARLAADGAGVLRASATAAGTSSRPIRRRRTSSPTPAPTSTT